MTQSPFPDKAMVLAAGLGTRMRPLTDAIPKPLVLVRSRPLIDWTLDGLEKSGVTDAVVNSHYKADMLEAHLAKRRSPRLHISREETLLDTGGGVSKALPLLGDAPFFVTNSDAIIVDGSVPALQRLWRHWDDARMDALLLLHSTKCSIGFEGTGDFFLAPEGNVRWHGGQPAPYVFTGTQLLHPRLFRNAPKGAFSLWKLSDPTKRPDGTLPRIFGLAHDGDWLHVGDPAGLAKAEDWLRRHS